jgi:hypothetical protein
MARKSLGDRRAEKLAQMEALKKQLAGLDAKASEHLGKLAVRAGLADLNLDDETLLREFQTIAGRFRGNQKEPKPAAPSPADPA